jgi:hypothetical protein
MAIEKLHGTEAHCILKKKQENVAAVSRRYSDHENEQS